MTNLIFSFSEKRTNPLMIPFALSLSGLVRSRDGSHLSPNTQPFISLPSPNIQSSAKVNREKQSTTKVKRF